METTALSLVLPALGLALGAAAGAFGATLALRRARGEQAVRGRSHCDGCGRTLGFTETVPVLSYLALHGRCMTCGDRIDPFHLWAEAGGALLVAAVLALRPFPLSLAEGLLAAILWWLALVDIRTFTLPNPLVAVTALLCALLGGLNGVLWLNLGLAVAMTVIFGGMAFGLRRLRGRTMLGTGDIKLIGALTLWLGADMPLALVAASLFGLLQIAARRGRDGAIAFGPPLMAGSLIVGLFVMPQFRLLEA